MRLIFSLLLMVSVIIVSKLSYASDPMWFTCMPDQTNQKTPENALRLGLLSDFDGKSYLLLHGGVTVPSGGYSYGFRLTELKQGIQYAELSLIPPKSGAIAMISTVGVNERHEITKGFRQFVIKVQKDFNWGVTQITCSVN